MFSEAKIAEIYCMADDFCKEFALQQEKCMVKESNHTHRNKSKHQRIQIYKTFEGLVTRGKSSMGGSSCSNGV